MDKSLALNPGVLSSIPGSPSLLDETLSYSHAFWDVLKSEPLLVMHSAAPGHKTTKNINLPGRVLVTAKEQPQKPVYWPFKGGASFADPICYFMFYVSTCFYYAVVSVPCGLVAACWDGMTSCLLFVVFSSVFAALSYGDLGLVWYLVESIPDLYLLLYFE